MKRIKNYFTIIAALIFFSGLADAQRSPQRAPQSKAIASSEDQCLFNGTYRIDVTESDRLYSVVEDARSSVPVRDQQQFFRDLSTRLTPPDMLAIECQGTRVTVGSSRAGKITYLADGINRRERLPDGSFVSSKITLGVDSLTFVSSGKAEDNVNVAFESLEDGRRLRVTRRIDAQQLPEPIVIQTLYDKISAAAEWNIYDGDRVAGKMGSAQPGAPPESNRAADALRSEFAIWIEATNRRDIAQQMRFYMDELQAFYLTRNTPKRAVRLEKERIFGSARSVDIRAGEPEIVFQNGGRTAI
ncbi:MAG: hypothetical protein H0U23_09065, partial [Blastocatellia bacterium]|nr:hypothetical protein [Blastocatellia bacterium]